VKRLLARSVSALALCAALLSGAVLVRGAAALAEGSSKQDVSNMDLDLLRENLLKIWIIEFTSQEFNQRRIAQKSFEGLNPVAPTGDPEVDRKNEEGRKKTSWELKHYLLLEYDGAIEAIDIVDRVVGTKVSLDPAAAEQRRFFAKSLGEIKWKNILLQAAIADLAKWTDTPISLHPEIPKNVTLELSFEAPAGFSVQSVLEFLNSQHPIEWKWVDGKVEVWYLGDLPKNPLGR
jgi:hypothetical protein